MYIILTQVVVLKIRPLLKLVYYPDFLFRGARDAPVKKTAGIFRLVPEKSGDLDSNKPQKQLFLYYDMHSLDFLLWE